MRRPLRSRSAVGTRALVGTLALAALLAGGVAAGTAHAKEAFGDVHFEEPTEPFPDLNGMPRSALSFTGKPRRASRPWVIENIRIQKGAGLGYSRPVEMNGRKLELGVKGPLMRRRNLGLTFEVRF